MTRRFVLATLIALAGHSVAGTTALADHEHVRDPHDRIRVRTASLAQHSRDLYYEIRTHARGAHHSAGGQAEALAIYRSANRIHALAAAHARYSTMEREVSRLESHFHELESALGHGGHHPAGHGHSGHGHVRELVRHIDHLVHDIHDDVHDLRDDFYPGVGPRYPERGVGLGPDGWYFGGGGFTLRLGR